MTNPNTNPNLTWKTRAASIAAHSGGLSGSRRLLNIISVAINSSQVFISHATRPRVKVRVRIEIRVRIRVRSRVRVGG
jgi:1-acyl-sn-glycerol-3-phosphate acyltransferase